MRTGKEGCACMQPESGYGVLTAVATAPGQQAYIGQEQPIVYLSLAVSCMFLRPVYSEATSTK